MIKENILNFTAVLGAFVLTGSSVQAETSVQDTNIKIIEVQEIVYPTSPEYLTQLDELDKIILEYEGQRQIVEAERQLEADRQRTIQMAEWAESNLFVSRQAKIDSLIESLLAQVGVTEYGFGDTPAMWDCSGLTKWYLSKQGIDVEHSATAQTLGGTRVNSPIAGDLVSFQKQGSSDYFHIGVYVGGGLMVHSSNPEKDTNLQSIYSFAESENSEIIFVRY